MVGGIEIDKETLSEFTSLFKFYIDAGRYSVVDRFAYAISPVSAIYALYEAVREIRSALDRAVEVEYEKEGKKSRVRCCEYEEYRGECKWLVGVAGGEKKYCCLPCPHIPSDEAVAKLVEVLRRDVSVATKIAAMAMAYRARRE
jgi:CRISPR type I-A-associated protein Csa5